MNNIKPIETEYKGYRFRSRLEARWAVFFDALGVSYEYEPEGFELPSGKRYLPDFKIKCYGYRGVCEYEECEICPCYGCKYHTGEEICSIQYLDRFCKLFDIMECYCQNKDLPEWFTYREKTGEVISCQKRKANAPQDLYIEVKGEMTQTDADKIHEFSKQFPVLVIGDIPDPDNYRASSYNLKSYDRMNGVKIYAWNYETIDGDYFAAYPAVKDGHFYLDGDDSNYHTMDTNVIKKAFRTARQARFEHGETLL